MLIHFLINSSETAQVIKLNQTMNSKKIVWKKIEEIFVRRKKYTDGFTKEKFLCLMITKFFSRKAI
jgi:hypothetical protein